MSEIRTILESNTRFRLEGDVPGSGEISALQQVIGKKLPLSYLEFLELRGLDDPRFTYEILSPSEIHDQIKYVIGHGLAPFASNGCGDLVCWSLEELPSSASYFWDHETDTYMPMLSSFEEALKSWRY